MIYIITYIIVGQCGIIGRIKYANIRRSHGTERRRCFMELSGIAIIGIGIGTELPLGFGIRFGIGVQFPLSESE